MSANLDPEWCTIIKAAIAKSLDEVHTSIPGKVVAYDPTTQTAIVKTASTKLPEIPDVPVAFPAGGGAYLHFLLVPGNTGMLLFSEIDTSDFRSVASGTPNVLTRHGLSGVFVPCKLTDAGALNPIRAAENAIGSESGAVMKIGSKLQVRAGTVPNPVPLLAADALVRHGAFDLWATAVETALNSAGFPVSKAIRVNAPTQALESE